MAGKGGKRSTSWKPGQSGNPRGRPRVVADVRELARRYTADAMSVLAAIMSDPKVVPAARVSAATALLDRGWGKPQPPINAEAEVVPPEVVERREKNRQIVYALLRRMETEGPTLDQGPAALPAKAANSKGNGHGD
jgi:Family of unknown function (DUF5681)